MFKFLSKLFSRTSDTCVVSHPCGCVIQNGELIRACENGYIPGRRIQEDRPEPPYEYRPGYYGGTGADPANVTQETGRRIYYAGTNWAYQQPPATTTVVADFSQFVDYTTFSDAVVTAAPEPGNVENVSEGTETV